MDKLVVEGGIKLDGSVAASGSKNATLPILFASILTGEPVELSNVPQLKDIETSFDLLRHVGCKIEVSGDSVTIDSSKLNSTEAPYDLVRTMRASFWILGPLLAREGKARVSLPGGCAIGSRPVDLHLMALEKLGVQYTLEQGYVVAACPNGLVGAEIDFPKISVGATEHAMMAAVLAKGRTVLRNCACEPEVVDLAGFLNNIGARISGAGTEEIIIEGATQLKGGKYRVMFDRIEAGTLLLAGPITGGRVRVTGVRAEPLQSLLDIMRKVGIQVSVGGDWIEASAAKLPKPLHISTEPFPGFPTDLQAQLMAYLACVDGESEIEETIFENRFMHVPELNRLGANISVEGSLAFIHGKSACYQGATVMATDLRASSCLVLAGLAGKGVTHIRRIYHLDRGYEQLENKLNKLGARVTREKE